MGEAPEGNIAMNPSLNGEGQELANALVAAQLTQDQAVIDHGEEQTDGEQVLAVQVEAAPSLIENEQRGREEEPLSEECAEAKLVADNATAATISAPTHAVVDDFDLIETSPSPPSHLDMVDDDFLAEAYNADEAPSFLHSSADLADSNEAFAFPSSPVHGPALVADPMDEISTMRYSINSSFEQHGNNINGSILDDFVEKRGDSTPLVDDSLALNALTSSVARKLIFLPQISDEDDEEERTVHLQEPNTLPPGHSEVPAVQISVVDPDNVWAFAERNITERMAHSKHGGCARAKFARSSSLQPHTAPNLPMLYLLLVRCETLQSYAATFRARVRAFVEEMQRTRQDSEFLLVGVESTLESRRVYQELMSQDVAAARIFTVNISDPYVAPNMEGEWGKLVLRMGQCIQDAALSRMPALEQAIVQASPALCENREEFSFLHYFTRVEALAFALLQIDRYSQAGALYRRLQTEYSEVKRMGGNAQVERMMTRQKMDCAAFLFPRDANDGGEEKDAASMTPPPSRIFDVTRLPFSQMIVGCSITSLQLEFYLFTRIVLCELATGDAAQAAVTGMEFLTYAQQELKYEYAASGNRDDVLTLIEAWVVCTSLELVNAGHTCAGRLPLHPLVRVRLCLIQAIVLEGAVAALDNISQRASGGKRTLVPQLIALNGTFSPPASLLPPALHHAIFSSFSTIYLRLLEASAAHFIAGGRFRTAAALTFRRALALHRDAAMLRDCSRWWSGQARVALLDHGLAEDGSSSSSNAAAARSAQQQQRHDHWPSLLAEAIPGELTPWEMRRVFPARRRMALARAMLALPSSPPPPPLLPVLCHLFEGGARLELEWVLPEILPLLAEGGKVDKTVLVCQNAASGEKINLMLDTSSMASNVHVRRLEDNPTPGEYLPIKAFVWINQGKPRECFVGTGDGSPVLVLPKPFPFDLVLDRSSFLVSGVETSQQLEANDCIQEVKFRLVKNGDGEEPQGGGVRRRALLLQASPGIIFVQDSLVFDANLLTIKLLVRQKLLPPGSTAGRFKVGLFLALEDKAPAHEFAFELPILFPVQVAHQVCFVPKRDNAALCFAFESSCEEICEMMAFSLSSIRPSMIRATPPSELFPVMLKRGHAPMHLSFILQELGELVPPHFAVTALFFLTAQVELLVEHGARKIVLNWSVPLLIERGDVVVTTNWQHAAFNTVPPLVSVRLMDKEEDLSGVEESTIMIEL